MTTGTITLINSSTSITGSSTAFSSELKAGDFIFTTVNGINYTLGVDSITSDTELTLAVAFNGATTSGLSFEVITQQAMVGITAQLAADTARAIRGLNYDKQNWQQILSGNDTVTVTLPDGSTYTGPAWSGLADQISSLNNDVSTIDGNVSTLTTEIGEKAATADVLLKADNLSSLGDASKARTNLGLGFAHSQVTGPQERLLHYDDSGLMIITRRLPVTAAAASTTAWSWNWETELGFKFTTYPGISVNGMGGNSPTWSVGTENVTNSSASGFINNNNSSALTIWLTITLIGTKA